ncbi:hypothetical protein MCEMOHM34_00897 [Candidatus Methylopumilus universalis]|uniref:hypothetical protein n=1 Tax=Candidatus Methylopumilus universalis TaxID=2588536 RepID=UPI003BEED499
MIVKNKFLFNFSASHIGGGYKRLFAYSKIFNSRGGAYFIIRPNCKKIALLFNKNKYFYVEKSNIKRLLNDSYYLKAILDSIGCLNLYYAYGIPIYSKIAKVNWFHVSNVLPLSPHGIPISLFHYVKMQVLGFRIRHNLINADVISAESLFSLGFFGSQYKNNLFLSVNGSDNEIFLFKKKNLQKKDNIAVVVGTYDYKAISESFYVFKMLKKSYSPELKLVIIGDSKKIPKIVISDKDVIIKGILSHESTINYLNKAKYYISTTYIENSYNAASEGVFLSNESYISDIAPHREFLLNIPFRKIYIKNISRSILHIRNRDISNLNMKLWENVVNEMLGRVKKNLISLEKLKT